MTHPLPSSEPAPSTRVLLVDDTPANLALLVDALHASGYRPLVAASGEAALERLRQVLPDLILLDMRMPGWSGMETIARIQAHPQWREIPVIFMTAVEEPEQKVQAFSAGAVDYVTKPFDTREVLARIETHLRLKALQRALADELAWRAETEQALRESLEQAVVVTGRDGRLQFCTLRAAQLLERYCPGGDGRLPEALGKLVDAGRSTRTRNPGTQGELEVRVVADPSGDAPATLLLEEHRAPGDFAPLRALGLSEREAEVLHWISQGKSNPEIGLIIGAASGTVKKHAENIFAKLGVEGRASAMRMALDAQRR